MSADIKGYVLPTKAEVVNDAIMSGQAALILEGSTDIQLYMGVSTNLVRETVLRPVELISGFGEGCSEVIRFFDELQESDDLRPYVPMNVIGVIDKDVRDFRNEIPLIRNIVILKFYSVESHFICSSVVTRCLVDSTYAPQDVRLAKIADAAFDFFSQGATVLYLASLEALKGAVDDTYQSEFGYADGYGRLNDYSLVQRLTSKQTALLAFADTHGLSSTIESMKRIVKGKVLLDGFCSELKKFVEALPGTCGTDDIPQCDYCVSGLHKKCCYRMKQGVTEKSLRNAILGQLPIAEFEYLIEELNMLLTRNPT